MNDLTDKIKDKIDTAIKKSIFWLYSQIVLNTPVRTGRARANWQIDIVESNGIIYDEDKSGSKAIARAEQIIISMEGVVFITNNLNYIRKLEHGGSKQAPQGMVKIAIERYHSIFSELIK